MATLIMPRKKPRPPRKKACSSCAEAKARCSLKNSGCSRCRLTVRNCVYDTTASALVQPDMRPAQGGLGSELGRFDYLDVHCFTSSLSASAALQTPLPLSDADAPSRSRVDNTIWYSPIQQSQGQSPRGNPKKTELHF